MKLPLHTKAFTTDVHSIYNNIDTDHAITGITWWIEDVDKRGLLPLGLPVEAVLLAVKIIMKNNLFDFEDLFLLQLLTTAMGFSAAVLWAILYFAYHDMNTILPKFGHLILYFKHYINDIFGV